MSDLRSDGYLTDLPYLPTYQPTQAPLAIRYAALVNGVIPPRSASGFRYIELGCGTGRSLCTLAAANPQGQFVGVDLLAEHTRAAGREIEAGELRNVQVVTAGFDAVPEDLGRFDFITLHGVWSWVGPRVRAQILAFAERRLAEGGLLLLSYNTMPGWSHLQPFRQVFRQHAATTPGGPVQQIRAAIGHLRALRDGRAAYFEENPRAGAYLDFIEKADPRYVGHEFLNEHWASFYFREVADAFGGAGLSFVGSLPLHTNSLGLCLRPELRPTFPVGADRLTIEAEKDLCLNTSFRWDIFGRAPRRMTEPSARLREADDLWYRVARPNLGLPHRATFGVVTATAAGPIYERLLARLGEAGSLRLSDLVGDPALARRGVAELVADLDIGVAMGLFEVSAQPVAPRARPLWSQRPERVSLPGALNRHRVRGEAWGAPRWCWPPPSRGTASC